MDTMNAVVETPGGSAQKFTYDPESRFFKLKKWLPAGMYFPYDFGFIPGTKGEDGDPLDIVIIAEFSSFPGCMIECKLIGGIKGNQSDGKSKKMIRNDRFFAVPLASVVFEKVRSMKDLNPELVNQLGEFFVNYNKLENRKFEVAGLLTVSESLQIINSSK